MEKGKTTEACGRVIIRRALEASSGQTDSNQPAVLSCGGIFIPRPRPINPRDPLYHILNTPCEGTPVKIVSALIHRNLLQEVLAKEALN